MKDLFINALELLCKIGVWILVGGGTALAWHATGNPWVTLFILLVSFILAIVLFGLVFLLIDINDNIRNLLYQVQKNSEPPPPRVPGPGR